MKDKTLYTFDDEEGIVLTDKGMKDPEIIKEFIQFKIDLELHP